MMVDLWNRSYRWGRESNKVKWAQLRLPLIQHRISCEYFRYVKASIHWLEICSKQCLALYGRLIIANNIWKEITQWVRLLLCMQPQFRFYSLHSKCPYEPARSRIPECRARVMTYAQSGVVKYKQIENDLRQIEWVYPCELKRFRWRKVFELKASTHTGYYWVCELLFSTFYQSPS